MKKINYKASIRLLTEKVHGIQIMKMCEAFRSLIIEVMLNCENAKEKDYRARELVLGYSWSKRAEKIINFIK